MHPVLVSQSVISTRNQLIWMVDPPQPENDEPVMGIFPPLQGDSTAAPGPSQATRGAQTPSEYQGMTLLDGSDTTVHVECFPNPLAGAPINDKVAHVPELAKYIASSGPFSNPHYFDAAQQQMWGGMTNSLRDWHLDSWPVSNG
jgi:hypothetical protein